MSKIIHCKDYLFFKDEQDFLSHVQRTLPGDSRFYVNHGYIEAMPEKFPATFHYTEARDWQAVDRADLVSYLRDLARQLNKIADDIKKI